MADETLSARVDRLAVENGLIVKDRTALIDTVARGLAGAPVGDDAALLATMREAGASVAPLNGPGPKDPAFRAFLGGLADDYDKMMPDRKLSLWREWRERQAAPDRIATLHSEMRVRTGEPSAIDRLRVAHALGNTRKPTKAAPIAATPALMTLPVHHRLAATHAISEAQRLAGSSREFDIRRLAELRSRWPGIVL